jgi:hypothetical protein
MKRGLGMQKETVKDFEWIKEMSEEFAMLSERTYPITPEEASVWQLRILLSIAQQLSVIAATLKSNQ